MLNHKTNKSATAYRTISEVGKELGVATHVLRFWETKFKEITPFKTTGGRRFYTQDDIGVLRNIQTMLHKDGYTIKGVQSSLKKRKQAMSAEASSATMVLDNGSGDNSSNTFNQSSNMTNGLSETVTLSVLSELRSIRNLLN